MMTLSRINSSVKNWRNNMRAAFLAFLSCSCLYHSFIAAQDVLPWSPLGSAFRTPWAESGISQWPYPWGDWSSTSPSYSWPKWGPERSLDDWQIPYGLGPAHRDFSGYEPDLTGTWRGSGGEKVEIRRNRARVWGGPYQSCNCVFFLVGNRLIAYSPDTDVVRKFHFRGGRDRFWLIDEDGQLMSFWRVR